MNPALDIATTTDIVVPTEKLRCGEPRYDPGGGGINVARAVHLLGGEARAICPAGGMSGGMLCGLLKDEDVPHTFVSIAGITRESLAVVEGQTGTQYRFLLPGPVLSARDQESCLDTLATYAPEASFLVVSGSLRVFRIISMCGWTHWRGPVACGSCSTRRDLGLLQRAMTSFS